jgi:hypothetical protein
VGPPEAGDGEEPEQGEHDDEQEGEQPGRRVEHPDDQGHGGGGDRGDPERSVDDGQAIRVDQRLLGERERE